METKIEKLDASNIDMDIIKTAGAIVDEGGFVAFPTETVYGIASRVSKDTLAKLDELKGRTADKIYTLHIGNSKDVFKYVPEMSLRARKLIQNAWPGPLTLVFDLNDTDVSQIKAKIGEEVFEILYKNNTIGIRCPDNPIASALLEQTKLPVVAPSANKTDEPPAVEAGQIIEQFSGNIDMILDGGPCKFKKSSTVAKIGKNAIEILRLGAYSQIDLEMLSQIKFLCVCTGNTCRSPMAEGVFKKYLAQKLNCKIDELEKIGYKVSSAGMIGSSGYPASTEAIIACQAQGIDIQDHRNQGLTRQLIEESDFIFAMERIHQARILALDPQASERCLLLADNQEIPDPIGLSQKYYDNCVKLIIKSVKQRISELVT